MLVPELAAVAADLADLEAVLLGELDLRVYVLVGAVAVEAQAPELLLDLSHEDVQLGVALHAPLDEGARAVEQVVPALAALEVERLALEQLRVLFGEFFQLTHQ